MIITEQTYNQFLKNFKSSWRQGEHLGIIGPTGCGKTYLAADLLEIRGYVVIITTKKHDKTLERYQGYKKIKKWVNDIRESRVMLRPISRELAKSAFIARNEIYSALSDGYIVGGWTFYIDDAFFVSDTLKLKDLLKMMYTQSRSNNVTLVSSLQRPSWIPIEILSQSTHVIVFKINDEKDLDRVSEATGMDRKRMRELKNSLDDYDFLYIKNGRYVEIVRKEGT
jgi:hypothetical protein